jgi:cytochrome bd-type quinol oxidase subunit 2
MVGCLPHWAIFSYQSANGVRSAPAVAYIMGEPMAADSVSFVQIYGSFWLLASLLMLLAAVVFVPYYTRTRQHAAIAAEHHAAETMRSISLIRVLIGSSGLALIIMINIVAQANGLTGKYPIQSLLSAVLICLQFLIFTLHENILKYVRAKLATTSMELHFSFGKSKNKIDPLV